MTSRSSSETRPQASSADALVSQIEHGGQIGTALRNIENCSQRIAALVGSLKVYARAEPDWTDGIDVHSTIEDVLLILANKLREVEVTKEFGDLPRSAAFRPNSSKSGPT